VASSEDVDKVEVLVVLSETNDSVAALDHQDRQHRTTTTKKQKRRYLSIERVARRAVPLGEARPLELVDPGERAWSVADKIEIARVDVHAVALTQCRSEERIEKSRIEKRKGESTLGNEIVDTRDDVLHEGVREGAEDIVGLTAPGNPTLEKRIR